MQTRLLLCLSLALGAAARAEGPVAPAAAPPAEVRVMVLGTFHMSNPGHDLHNQKVDDVLAPPRQAQLGAVVDGLARFAPTLVAVEWEKEATDERYQKYLAGTLPASRNEVVQLGFRLARRCSAQVEGIDVDGDFPYPPVEAWAAANGRKAELDALGAAVEQSVREQQAVLDGKGIGAALRWMNEPSHIFRDQAFYRQVLRFGAGNNQPGAELNAAWSSRNFRICARLAQRVRPGDRVVILYGAGHAHLLRQCVQEMPGWKLVEPNDYLDAGK